MVSTLDARQAAQSRWVARLGRFGLASRGVLYIVLAYLAVRVAFGRSNAETDRQGALHAIAREPFGRFLLVVLALGFAGYAIWQLSKAALGGSARAGSDKPAHRGVALFKGLSYGFFCFTTVALAAGSSKSSSSGGGGSDQQSVDWTAKAMRHGSGRTLVGLVGLALIVTGIVLVGRALSGEREVDLRIPNPSMRRSIEFLGAVGMTARAVIVGAAGVFVLEAAVAYDPKKAKGLDGTLKSFAHTAAGPSLLALVAAGVLCYGLYSVAQARYAAI
jgi:Domain of Unknown Function (DUF1206)